MNQPQTSGPQAPEPQEITVRIEIKVRMGANLSNLTALVEKTKPLITSARELGEARAVAVFGKQKLAIV